MKITPLGTLAAAWLAFSAPLAEAAKISVDVFYDALEPYGDWIETSDYGYVWHPRDVDESWRPYTVGNWAYTDAGWTWVSEEPFGWATYHYGRWANLEREGWVWRPDTEWAPAWVSWRHSDRYVGWAPLPPEAHFEVNVGFQGWVDSYYDIGPTSYSFVSVRDLGAPRLRQVIVEPRQNLTILNETRNITRITYNRDMIVNEGPQFDVVSRVSAQPIRRLRLERRTDVDASVFTTRSERLTQVSGDSLRVVAPEVEVRRDAVPKKVVQRIQQVQVNRGWRNAGDAQQVQQLRQRIATEEKAPASLPPRARLRSSDATAPAPSTTHPAETPAPGAKPAPGSNTAEAPSSRRGQPGQPTPSREATTPEPGTPGATTAPGAETPRAKPQPGEPRSRTPGSSRERTKPEPGTPDATPAPGTSTDTPGAKPQPGEPRSRTPGSSREPEASRTTPDHEATPSEPGAPGTKPTPGSREGERPQPGRPGARTPGSSRHPDAEPSEPGRGATAPQPGVTPDSPDRPSATEPSGRRSGRRPGNSNADDAKPPVTEGPGRRPGRAETPDANEAREPKTSRKESNDDAGPGHKPATAGSDEPKAGTRRPGAPGEAEGRSERPSATEKPKAPHHEASEDDGARRTPPARTERSERGSSEKPAGSPAAEKRHEGNAAEHKEVPKSAEKKDKD